MSERNNNAKNWNRLTPIKLIIYSIQFINFVKFGEFFCSQNWRPSCTDRGSTTFENDAFQYECIAPYPNLKLIF